MRHLPARLLTVLLAVMFLTACGDDDTATTAEATSSTTTTESTTTTTTGSTTSEPDDGPLADARTCTSPDGFTISYPADWDAVSECGQFGPAPVEEPTPDTDERPGVVSAYVDPVAFEDVSGDSPGAEEQERTETEVDGHPAVRVEAVVTDGLYPEGTRTVRWMIDLTDGSDQPRTLFANAVDVHDDVDFDEAVDVLDAMVERVQIDTQPTQGGTSDPPPEPAD